MLRLVVDGKTTVEAPSVSYHQRSPDLFEVPSDYDCACARRRLGLNNQNCEDLQSKR
jgi:hypothetical protein